MDCITERKHKLKRGLVFPHEVKKGPVQKKTPFGRILAERESKIIGYTFSFHATKGNRMESPKRARARFRMAVMRGGR